MCSVIAGESCFETSLRGRSCKVERKPRDKSALGCCSRMHRRVIAGQAVKASCREPVVRKHCFAGVLLQHNSHNVLTAA